MFRKTTIVLLYLGLCLSRCTNAMVDTLTIDPEDHPWIKLIKDPKYIHRVDIAISVQPLENQADDRTEEQREEILIKFNPEDTDEEAQKKTTARGNKFWRRYRDAEVSGDIAGMRKATSQFMKELKDGVTASHLRSVKGERLALRLKNEKRKSWWMGKSTNLATEEGRAQDEHNVAIKPVMESILEAPDFKTWHYLTLRYRHMENKYLDQVEERRKAAGELFFGPKTLREYERSQYQAVEIDGLSSATSDILRLAEKEVNRIHNHIYDLLDDYDYDTIDHPQPHLRLTSLQQKTEELRGRMQEVVNQAATMLQEKKKAEDANDEKLGGTDSTYGNILATAKSGATNSDEKQADYDAM